MRRVSLVLALGLGAAAVALIALFFSASLDRTQNSVELGSRETGQSKLAVSVGTELSALAVIESQGTEEDYKSPMISEVSLNTAFVDEATARQIVREDTTQEVHEIYSLLIRDLDLTASETEALLAFLIEDLIAKTRTRYSSGKGLDDGERANRIAAIIGDAKLKQFMALERNRREYAEVQNVRSMLQQREISLTGTQRDGFLKILVDIRAQDKILPGADSKPGSIESLEYILDQMDEYERLVLEQAPSVLSVKQVEYLFERYQALSYRRARSLEIQTNMRADGVSEVLPLWYPARD